MQASKKFLTFDGGALIEHNCDAITHPMGLFQIRN